MSDLHYDYCVVGAGAAGLTLSYELLKGGASVLLLEREERIGGLAKSYTYDGHIFDTGPKRFHTDDTLVLKFLDEIAGGGMLRIPRSTEVHFLNRYFEWPLRIQDLWKMPLGVSLGSMADLLRRREAEDPCSFHQYIRQQYGETLYQIFFRPYTEKFLRWDSEDLHSDWASTGINRTVVDSRIRTNSLLDLARTVLLPSKIKTEFLYPPEGGFGRFFETLLAACRYSDSFELGADETITSLLDSGAFVRAETSRGRVASCRELIWTGNLNNLLQLAGTELRVPYLNTIFYNVVCCEAGVRRRGTQWIYVSRGDALISRITCMKEFGPYTCPPGYYSFICEVTDGQTAPTHFENPQSLVDGILKELVGMRFLNRPGRVEAVHINPVRDTYPIYDRRYLDRFDRAAAIVRQRFPRVRLAGRTGAFWYNNCDHSIRFAIETAREILASEPQRFDFREYFGGVYGRAASARGV